MWRCGSRTHVGHVRRTNEDALLVSPDVGLWAVADGMGGYEAGDVASRLVIDALKPVQRSVRLDSLIADVEVALAGANQRMRDWAQEQPRGCRMGSTVVVMVAQGSVGACIWAGDSRLYRLRNDFLEQLTQDHSRVGELEARGFLSEEEARLHPLAHLITRAVGVDEQLELDKRIFDILPGDLFLMSSDGLHDELDRQSIRALLQDDDPQLIADRLVERCLAGRGRDNITALVVIPGTCTAAAT